MIILIIYVFMLSYVHDIFLFSPFLGIVGRSNVIQALLSQSNLANIIFKQNYILLLFHKAIIFLDEEMI